MSKIWDWPVEIKSRSMLHVPYGTQFLSIIVKNEQFVHVYGLVPDPVEVPVPRILRVVSAGEEFNHDGLIFMGSFQIGWFYGHVFEQPSQGEPDEVDSRYHDDHEELRKSAR